MQSDHQNLIRTTQDIINLQKAYVKCSKEYSAASAISNFSRQPEALSTLFVPFTSLQRPSIHELKSQSFDKACFEETWDGASVDLKMLVNNHSVVEFFSMIETLTESQRRATIHAAAATNSYIKLLKSLMFLKTLLEKALEKIKPRRRRSKPIIHKAIQTSMQHLHIFRAQANCFSTTIKAVQPWIARMSGFLKIEISECYELKADLVIRNSVIETEMKCASTWLGNANETIYWEKKIAREMYRTAIYDAQAEGYADLILTLEYLQRRDAEDIARKALNAWIEKEESFWERAFQKEQAKKRIREGEIEAADHLMAVWIGNMGETSFWEADRLRAREEINVCHLIEGMEQYASSTSLFLSPTVSSSRHGKLIIEFIGIFSFVPS
ncbi:hypothetical protein HDU67_006522 [Dinochytrium kinnereticum]|nr:hypothetical protein HDU67_006522 [Dinochytrium kinnereticum]